MTSESFTFTTRLESLPIATSTVPAHSSFTPSELKKKARIHASLTYSTSNIGFMHACLVKLGDQYFLITGPSGVGKSTHATFLAEQAGGSILANDWVAVEKDGHQLYASDLNLEAELKHSQRCLVSGFIFLTNEDEFSRDAYVPNRKEYTKLITQSFDDMELDKAEQLSKFWLQAGIKLPFYCALPTRTQSETYTSETILSILQRWRPADDLIEVGIIGIGAVGSTLAAQLGQLPFIHKVHIFNRSKTGALGLALDLNQAMYRGRHDIFVAHDTAEDLFRQSSSVFLTYREAHAANTTHNVPDRWGKVIPHTTAAKHYAQLAARVSFSGTLFVITNPVDYLSYVCYKATQAAPHSLRTFQVYGIGLEGDLARAIFYGKRLDPLMTTNRIELFGNHADDFVLNTRLPQASNSNLLAAVVNASAEIRSHNIRTVHGPVAAAIRTYCAFARGGSASVAVIQEGAYIGRRITFKFGLPMHMGSIRDEQYQKLLDHNKQLITRYG